MKASNILKSGFCLFGAFALCISAYAGTYKTITLDGDFSDWVGVPILSSNTTATGNPVDFLTLYAANDENNLYLRVVYNDPVAVNFGGTTIYIALDNDNNLATGFNIFGNNLIGSDIGWSNDFPFVQTSSNFNTGESLDNAAAAIALYSTTVSEQEIGISRSATYTASGDTIFPSNTIGLAMYTSGTTQDDFLGAGTYTFAVPEPEHFAMIFVGVVGLLAVARRRFQA